MKNLKFDLFLGNVDIDFKDYKIKESVHGIHSYPAMMPAPLAEFLIQSFTERNDIVLDPFCGSGTVLYEALKNGRNAIGVDINPLAILISNVKINIWKIELSKLEKFFIEIFKAYQQLEGKEFELPKFKNIDFWFKKEVQINLQRLKTAIEVVDQDIYKLFFKLVFAKTVRNVSNTRNSEFKLYRLEEEKLKQHNPDVWKTFERDFKVTEEKLLYREITNNSNYVKIFHKNILDLDEVENETVDLILTSPPYGDARTTVAYGQFSRLSLQWLNLWEYDVDKESLGGKKKIGEFDPILFQLPVLNSVFNKILQLDSRRAEEVLRFFHDYFYSIKKLTKLVRKKGYAVYVVANRKVRGIEIPTDEITKEMFEFFGFVWVDTLERNIINKRMPLKNSPSNIQGQKDNTMLKEKVVILRKI